MKKHYGNIVEHTVRKKGFNIAELARLLCVNRRSVYNWFNQENLKTQMIFRVGAAIKHDFSKEFPELFDNKLFLPISSFENVNAKATSHESKNVDSLWKDRYVTLLQSYNSFLLMTTSNKTKKI